jgi:ArsR family transcriptional regulator
MKTIAKHFKTLSDPTRLRILALLAAGPLCVCDVMAVLQLPQSTVSRHLATLRDAGWVHGKRQGQWMVYELADACPLPDFLMHLPQLLSELPEAAGDRQALEVLLEAKDGPVWCASPQ